MSNYLTTQEVADRLGVSVFTIRRYIRSGIIKAVRLEGAYRVHRDDLGQFLRGREIGPEPESMGPTDPVTPPRPDEADTSSPAPAQPNDQA